MPPHRLRDAFISTQSRRSRQEHPLPTADPRPKRFLPDRIDLLVLGAVLSLCGARLLWQPGLLGSPSGEVYGHAWVQWWHGRALPSWPGGTRLALGADPWPVIDPLVTAFSAIIGRLSTPTIGYNAWIFAAIALAFLGGRRLAQHEGGDPLTGGLVLALWPALLGSLSSGLTEDGAIGIAAFAFVYLADPQWRRGLWAGALLGLLAWCGLVNAWYAAFASLFLGILRGWSRREAWPGLVLGAVIAGAMVLPLALGQGERLSGVGHRSGDVMARVEPLWRLNPWRGVDLLSLIAPGVQDPAGAMVRIHPGYLGIAPMLLALRAGWSGWWGILLVCAGLAVGPHVSVMGQPTGLANPFALFASHLPFGGLLNHYGRALLLGGVAMAVLAARGAMTLPARWRPLAAAIVAIDLALLSPLPLPLPVTDATPPAVAEQLDGLSKGAVLVVPPAGPGVNFQRPLYDQRAHTRPLLMSPNRPGLPPTLMNTDAGRWLAGLAFKDGLPPPAKIAMPPSVAVVLAMPGYADAVAEGLGPPDRIGDDGSAAWDMRR